MKAPTTSQARSPSKLAQAVLQHAQAQGTTELLLYGPLVVGVSGGADSLALLLLLCELLGESAASELHVAHLNHKIRGDAALRDVEFVSQVAAGLGIGCSTTSFDVPAYAAKHHLSLEDAARRARYAYMANIAAQQGGVVAVAHNADDQAETVLMHLMRGSGIAGLAGMRHLSQLPIAAIDEDIATLLGDAPAAPLALFRPLLGVQKAEIEDYCRDQGVVPVEDETNSDLAYRRNLVRHAILPLLAQTSPQIKQRLANLARVAADETDLLEKLLDAEWKRVVFMEEGSAVIGVVTSAFAELPVAIQRRLVRRAISIVAGSTDGVTFTHTEAVRAIFAGKSSPTYLDLPAGIRVQSRKGVARLGRSDQLAAGSLQQSAASWPSMHGTVTLDHLAGGTASLEQGWTVTWRTVAAGAAPVPDLYSAVFDADVIEVGATLHFRTRKRGDMIVPLGMSGHKRLQDVLVDAKIPRDIRDRLPVLVLKSRDCESVLWIPGPGGRRAATAPVGHATARVVYVAFTRQMNEDPEQERNRHG